MPPTTAYAELHCISNFTFLRGASHPEELVLQAAKRGYRALALTDECSLAGVVRAHLAARECGLQLIIGSEVTLEEGLRLVLLVTDRQSYGALATLITLARRRTHKGEYRLGLADLEHGGLQGCLALLLAAQSADDQAIARLNDCFPERLWLAAPRCYGSGEAQRLHALSELGRRSGIALVATGDVHMHARSRRVLRDTLAAIRAGCTVAEAHLQANSEDSLRSLSELSSAYPEPLLAMTLTLAARCRFSLDELRYEYPQELTPPGVSPRAYLRDLCERGMVRRWPRGAPDKVRELVDHELRLITELHYEPYFLTVFDIVRFARNHDILCQGRGSAANSAVCYCLGITEVDPERMAMLFERFISRERNEPPDIDVDFEHDRREEVIQYIYEKYGRERAALTATVVTYQPRSAIRDLGKALGLDLVQVDRLAKSMAWWDGKRVLRERFGELGFDWQAPLMQRLATLVETLVGFPRHLSQHTGGFVIARDALSSLVPIENAAMVDRTVIQWDKNDLEALGLLKVDVLALGMLSAIHRCFDLIAAYRGKRLTLADVPAEDPAVYDMIQHADTVGVFQIESRAQMAMLPRLRPRTFYDLVIEVAIVRPGPIQGGMVHPYLRRRQGLEPVSYPSAAVRGVLKRTLGIPIFQEQVMQLAVVAAGFSLDEADQLRRAMAAWKRRDGLEPFEQRLTDGMRERGYSSAFAQQIFNQIRGFGDYGFPESHAASFALLVYVSAWLKFHEPAAFVCALLNSQPMGFYAPAQLLQDARHHGVAVRAVDVNHSDWDNTLEDGAGEQPTLRLGFRQIKGFRQASAERLVAARAGSWATVQELASAAALQPEDLQRLASAGALRGLAGNRYESHWSALGVEQPLPLLPSPRFREATPLLSVPSEGEDIVHDYRSLGVSLGRHPLALLRPHLQRLRLGTAEMVRGLRHGERVRAAGLVINRQRPSTASGVIFMTLEDETGYINVVLWPWVVERQRRIVLGARLIAVHGSIEREGEVVHLVANRLVDHSALLGNLETRSRNFR